ncbi:glycosyltransferase [Dyadobacter bucti]|uniref:glycosyltransferase n=1 Tax=Dyadobacter bucti TaxID=2572203 RepID=UPI003F6E79C5
MVAILHPYILHYREDFFKGIGKMFPLNIYCYEDQKEIGKANFKEAQLDVIQIKSIKIGPFLWYSPKKLLSKENDVLVLMLTFLHLTTWILLLTKPFHRKKIILWGHGISVKRFVKEEKKPDVLLKVMIMLADKVWFYTRHELKIWNGQRPGLSAVSLDNTISDVDEILTYEVEDKDALKRLFNITQPRILIYCARFNEPGRRPDLLLQAVQNLDPEMFGFVIIGEGKLKPDFAPYPNVYDFGAVYETKLKKQLFQLADIYFQPGWVGLSIVEAMAYAKPVFTLERTESLLQCVEYSYIEHNYNGMLFGSIQEFYRTVTSLSVEDIKRLSDNARAYTKAQLKMQNMVQNASSSIQTLSSHEYASN